MNKGSEDASLIKMKALEQEYEVTLREYNQAYQTYINTLQTGENTAVSSYNQIIGGGGVCTGSNTTFPDGSLVLNTGNYPSNQCAALCDENPYCAGYYLSGPNDSNGNPSCNLFAYTDASGIANGSGEGCFTKKNYQTPTSTTTTTTNSAFVGIGTDGLDYYKSSLSAPWQRLTNDTAGDLIACAIDPTTNKYYVVNKDNAVSYKKSYTDYSFTSLTNCSQSTNYKKMSVNGQSNLICSGGSGYKAVKAYPYYTQQTQSDCEATCNNDPSCIAYDMVPNGQNNGTNQCAYFSSNNHITPEPWTGTGLGCYEKNGGSYTQMSVGGATDLVCSGGPGYEASKAYPYWTQQTQTGCEATCNNDPNCVAYDMVPNGRNDGTYQCAFFASNNDITPVSGGLGCYEKGEQIACILDLAISPDGLYGVVIDTKRQLWSGLMSDFLSGFSPAANTNQFESSTALAISPEGMVFTVGANQLYTKPSYLGMSSELWAGPIGSSCCVSSITFLADGTLIGVGTDFNMYSKSPDNGYTGPWSNVTAPNDTVQIISIAAINTSSTSTALNIYTPPPVTNNNATAQFVSLQGQNYWGSASLNEGPVASLEDCEKMCASDENCTGATYQSNNNYCYTRQGEGNLVPGLDSDYALIPEIRQSLIVLNTLNTKLLNINQEITSQVKTIYPVAKEDMVIKNEKQRELNVNYAKLIGEQTLIKTHLQQVGTLEIEHENNTLVVNQHNLLLRFWSIFALVVLAITFKFVFNIQGSSLIFLMITILLMAISLSLDWWSLIPVILLPLLFKMIYYPS